MPADTASSVGAGEVPCPDPSAHDHSNRLSAQASTAALYVTNPERNSASRDGDGGPTNPLDADGRLSSKSAATSLKYAKAQDLPSFPSRGHAAGSAGKAAMLAKDYKMKELWQPEQSLAGSRAALLAHGKGGQVDLWQASATSDGHSAATLAMRNKTLSPNVDYGVTSENKSKALLAATMSHNKGRQRAGSTPTPAPPAYIDAQNSSANALRAATASHSASIKGPADGWNSPANQAARVKNLGANMDREMFGERPPVDIEREETKHQEALRASAISMAKQIYASQNRTAMTADPADVAGAQAAAARSSTSAQQPDIKQEAMRYITLQEKAHKLAAERLAKVDKNHEAARYREYYGYEDKPKTLSSRLSMRSGTGGGRQRMRASSEGTAELDDSDDEEQARRIRSEMSQLHSGLSKVDARKQQDDRARLLAVAEKRVSARMHNMDEKVFADTGKVPPALMEEWEEKARQRAQRDREQQAQNPGKTHIGGGKFMEQSEIEAIAAARLKPTLDEINDTAEKRRARDEEIRLEREEEERQRREEKARNREEKDEQKRVKNEEKAAIKKEKDEEKSRKTEEKRVAKEEKRKSRDVRDPVAAGAAGATLAEVAEKVKDDDDSAAGEADDGVQKHRSALSRLKEKFRKSHTGASQPENEERRATPAGNSSGEMATAAVTGGTAAEVIDHSHGTESDAVDREQAPSQPSAQAEHEKPSENELPTAAEHREQDVPVILPTSSRKEVADDEAKESRPIEAATGVAAAPVSDDEPPAPVSRPERPPFEQRPSLVGYHNDELPTEDTGHSKPNLERHISQIPESDYSESDEDWDDEPVKSSQVPLGERQAQVVAERVVSAPVAAASIPQHKDTDEALSQFDDQRADPPKNLPATLESPGVPKAAPLVTDPATTDPNIQLETDADKKDRSILRQILNPHGEKYDSQGYGETAHAATVTNPEPAVGAKETQPTEPAKLKKKQEVSTTSEEQDKERKGFRGFFNKLRNKESKSEEKNVDPKPVPQSKSVPYESTSPGEKPVTTPSREEPTTAANTAGLPPVDAGPSLTEHTGTDGPIGDSRHVSGLGGNPRAVSPSSFKRGEAESNNPDDVSSSGADEDDLSRGRGGRLARKLGFGKGKGKADDSAEDTKDRQNSDGVSDEQFEEARDHFDETLAPPPAFAGQAKSESPVRGTRFQEEL